MKGGAIVSRLLELNAQASASGSLEPPGIELAPARMLSAAAQPGDALERSRRMSPIQITVTRRPTFERHPQYGR